MADRTVAIVGATGAVGRTMLSILEERDFPIRELRLMASARSAGTQVTTQWGELEVEDLGLELREYGAFALSPDGKRLAASLASGEDHDIWIYDLDRPQAPLRITFGGTHNWAIWSRDGRYLLYGALNDDGAPRRRSSDGVDHLMELGVSFSCVLPNAKASSISWLSARVSPCNKRTTCFCHVASGIAGLDLLEKRLLVAIYAARSTNGRSTEALRNAAF